MSESGPKPPSDRNLPRPTDKIEIPLQQAFNTARNVKPVKPKVTAKKRTLDDFLNAALLGPTGTSDQAG